MKIAFIGQKGIPAKCGGIETHVDFLSRGLVKLGHEVFVYTRPWYTDKNLTEYQGVKLISLTTLKTKHLDAIVHSFLASFYAIFHNFDVIHYHGVGPALCAWIPRLFKPSVKVVVTFHCIDRKHQKWGIIARLALRLGEWFSCAFSHKTITVSKTLQNYCEEVYDAETIYIPNGVEVQSRVSHNIIKENLGLEKGSYILFLSRLVRHKGAHLLIDAYKNLQTTKKLVIAGGSAFTDDYVKEIKTLANDNPNIIFTDVQAGTDLWRELYSNAYCFVLPSMSEGLPIVVLEAMSFGAPVLASDIPENKEIVGDNKFGLLFKNKNLADLQDKLSYLLNHQIEARARAAAGLELVKENYNWSKIIAQVDSVYWSLA
ncbi:glycosyltransferase family 4 protein [Candidatus Falkowbacteria bacterium]|nr:glycosyltransferase family 4 protein [Candidatus Falkowbacteria bacterium]